MRVPHVQKDSPQNRRNLALAGVFSCWLSSPGAGRFVSQRRVCRGSGLSAGKGQKGLFRFRWSSRRAAALAAPRLRGHGKLSNGFRVQQCQFGQPVVGL